VSLLQNIAQNLSNSFKGKIQKMELNEKENTKHFIIKNDGEMSVKD
jgi:hypothetical protein